MSHFAKIEDNIVTSVIVAEADHIATLEGTWVKTSYNMHGGIYCDPATNEAAADQSVINGDEARERKNYAGIGCHYGLYGHTGSSEGGPGCLCIYHCHIRTIQSLQ